MLKNTAEIKQIEKKQKNEKLKIKAKSNKRRRKHRENTFGDSRPRTIKYIRVIKTKQLLWK